MFVAGAAKTARHIFYTGLNGTTGMRSGFDVWPVHAAYAATLFKYGKEGWAFLHVVGVGKGISLEIHVKPTRLYIWSGHSIFLLYGTRNDLPSDRSHSYASSTVSKWQDCTELSVIRGHPPGLPDSCHCALVLLQVVHTDRLQTIDNFAITL